MSFVAGFEPLNDGVRSPLEVGRPTIY